jgi:hypothetical protein
MKKIILGVLFISSIFILGSCSNDEEVYLDKSQMPKNIPPVSQKEMDRMAYVANLYKVIYNVEVTGKTFELSKTEGKFYIKEIKNTTKEEVPKPDFWSCDRDEFYKWVDKKLEEGCTVTITYDTSTGCYFGWATPPTKPL